MPRPGWRFWTLTTSVLLLSIFANVPWQGWDWQGALVFTAVSYCAAIPFVAWMAVVRDRRRGLLGSAALLTALSLTYGYSPWWAGDVAPPADDWLLGWLVIGTACVLVAVVIEDRAARQEGAEPPRQRSWVLVASTVVTTLVVCCCSSTLLLTPQMTLDPDRIHVQPTV